MASPAPEDLRIASRIAIFAGLKPETVARLIAPATIVTLEHGDCLFHQGDPATAFFIIVDGWMKLYRITMGGDEAIIHVLTKGESVAESMALTGARYAATAEAVSDVRVVRIPADYLVRCVREMPDIALAMIASTSQRLHRLVRGDRASEGSQRRPAGRGVPGGAVSLRRRAAHDYAALRQDVDCGASRAQAGVAFACLRQVEARGRRGSRLACRRARRRKVEIFGCQRARQDEFRAGRQALKRHLAKSVSRLARRPRGPGMLSDALRVSRTRRKRTRNRESETISLLWDEPAARR